MKNTSLALIAHCIEQAKKQGADAADAVLFVSENTSCRSRMGKPETIERAENKDLGLRVLVKGKKGMKSAIVSSNDFSPETLNELVSRAVAMAKIAPEDAHTALADESLLAKKIPALELADDTLPDEKTLRRAAGEAEEAALKVKGVTNSEGADATASASEVFLATSHGFQGHYRTTSYSVSASIIAGKDTEMETDFDYSVARRHADLKSAAMVGKSAAERAVAKLNPRKAKTCQVPVVFEPRVARGLLGSFAGAINGAQVARGTSFLKDKLNTQVFAKGVQVLDDPLIKRGVSSHPFDAEGVSCRKLAVVEDGVLTTWILDTRSARQLKMHTTGHATRGTSSPPRPSTTNFYMAAGKISPEALMADIKDGFYVTEAFGMGVNDVTGDYSQGAAGFWIENGKLTYAVSGITIAGNMKDMFLNVTPASDLEMQYGTNAPTLRIEGMTIAGA